MDPILIVDDEKDNLEALRRMLRGQYDVSVVESPIEALKLVQSRQFHVIVSDQRMPEMTGVELLEKVKKLSPLSTRVLLTGYTDIDSVIDAINRGQIYRYVSKPWEPEDFKITLRQANEAFLLRKELQEKNASLEKALKDLTVLDKAKSRFLSLISHELNTPLTIMNSFIDLIAESKKELPNDFAKAISSIQGASRRLGEIVSEVVDYVKFESDSNLNKEKVDVVNLLCSVIEEVKIKTEEKKLKILINTPKEASLVADFKKLRTAFLCLAYDTVKRSPYGSSIELKLVDSGKDLVVHLKREGEPINEDAFNLLETGQSQMHHQQNLGVSLALCKTIVEQHLGEILATSHENQSSVVIRFKK